MTPSYATVTKNFKTIIDFLRFGLSEANTKSIFYGHGTDNAWDDMLALILGSLSLPLDAESFLLQANLTENEKMRLCTQLERRLQERIPVPYLTNTAYFCGLSFYVDDRVLIPRSPLAELIEHHFAPWISEDQVSNVLDLCTGSGCIAIACCKAFPEAEVDAVDISKEALVVAEINRQRHNVQEQLTLIESDCWEAVPNKKYDIIVSNPPYVCAEEMLMLPQEYQHEPDLALEAADDGLAIAERILHQAGQYLSAHGILVVEVGNSEEMLVEKYPHVPFIWLEFERGGQGVFFLTKQQLQDYFNE